MQERLQSFPLGDMTLQSGHVLPDAQLAFVTCGTLSPNGDNAVLQIELDGTNAVGGNGLMIQVGTATTATTVRGLVINRFSGAGIQVFQGPTTGIVIAGNFIGTAAAGALDRGNVSAGIRLLEAAGVHIGGTEPEARNVMSV